MTLLAVSFVGGTLLCALAAGLVAWRAAGTGWGQWLGASLGPVSTYAVITVVGAAVIFGVFVGVGLVVRHFSGVDVPVYHWINAHRSEHWISFMNEVTKYSA